MRQAWWSGIRVTGWSTALTTLPRSGTTGHLGCPAPAFTHVVLRMRHEACRPSGPDSASQARGQARLAHGKPWQVDIATDRLALTTLVLLEPIRTAGTRAANAVGSSAILAAATSHHRSIGLTVTTDHGEVETPELGLTRNWLLVPHSWARRREDVPGAVTVKIAPGLAIMR